MRLLRLAQDVAIDGPDYFGRPSRIHFRPFSESGWYWQTRRGILRITPGLLRRRQRQLLLVSGADELTVFEYVGALRFTGLDNILIESPRWPPYHGKTLELWEALKRYIEESDSHARWYTPIYPIRCNYPYDQRRTVRLEPSLDKTLRVAVAIDYRGLGALELRHDFPDTHMLKHIFEARSQGWPRGFTIRRGRSHDSRGVPTTIR